MAIAHEEAHRGASGSEQDTLLTCLATTMLGIVFVVKVTGKAREKGLSVIMFPSPRILAVAGSTDSAAFWLGPLTVLNPRAAASERGV